MRRYIVLLLAFLLGLLALTPLALAQPLDEEVLAGVFPEYPGDLEDITRGEFAALLVKAAGIPVSGETQGYPADVDHQAWYAPALITLWEKNLIKGYPDGTLRPEGPLSNLEAIVLVARTLGLPDGIKAAADSNLDEDNWGYVPHSWLLSQGIIGPDYVNPDKLMRVGGAIKFLAQVFGSDPQAEAIMSRAQQAQLDAKGISLNGDMAMIIRPRAELPGLPPELKELQIKASLASEMLLPATLHQAIKIEIPFLPIPGATAGEPAVMEMEQYLVDGAMYQKITDLQTGEARWTRLPEGAIPNLEELMKVMRESGLYQQAIPAELRQYFHYQFLGTTEINGHKVYKIGLYGRIDDFASFMNTLMGLALPQGMPGMTDDAEFQKGLGLFNEIIKFMSYWGVYYIGVEDGLTYGGQFRAVMAFGEKFNEETIPFKNMEFEVQIDEYKYDDNLIITLPPEAEAAEVLPLSPAAEQVPEMPAAVDR